MTYTELAGCVFAHWTPRIVDPNWKDWVKLSVYVLAFALSVMVASIRNGIRRRWMWWLLAACLLLLGMDKQLDIQGALAAAGRCVAHANGWYAERRPFQENVLIVLAVVGVASFLLVSIVLGGAWRQSGVAFFGLCMLATFVMMRTISFHYFDAVIDFRAFGISVNFVLENSALALICGNAIVLIRRHRVSRFTIR